MLDKNIKELVYFDREQETLVGERLQNHLNAKGILTNVPNTFVVGNYNSELSSDPDSFCGQFRGHGDERYFIGEYHNSNNVVFGTKHEMPKLGAINDDAIIFEFKYLGNRK